MMILLRQREYNDLLAKSTGIEAQVEHRLEEEKRKLFRQVLDICRKSRGVPGGVYPHGFRPQMDPVMALEEIAALLRE